MSGEPAHEPEVIPPGRAIQRTNPLANLAEALGTAINQITTSSGVSLRAMPRQIEYEDLPQEDKAVVDALMEKLKPDIEEKAAAILAAEIRDRLVRQGDIVSMEKLLKKGKKPHIKRKKGCIFLQFGSGEAIEEFLVAST